MRYARVAAVAADFQLFPQPDFQAGGNGSPLTSQLQRKQQNARGSKPLGEASWQLRGRWQLQGKVAAPGEGGSSGRRWRGQRRRQRALAARTAALRFIFIAEMNINKGSGSFFSTIYAQVVSRCAALPSADGWRALGFQPHPPAMGFADRCAASASTARASAAAHGAVLASQRRDTLRPAAEAVRVLQRGEPCPGGAKASFWVEKKRKKPSVRGL